ncbi:Phospholipid scramblase 2 [Clonorchis sinensis]|uniref:Phospholipid scramblase n=1 Tax=Clonorchis sinensis TaxID=79923 RepID=A0A8T1ML36_CLOSI|nr:Phospholipid scramblase 2 [Clonorchis sinensis]
MEVFTSASTRSRSSTLCSLTETDTTEEHAAPSQNVKEKQPPQNASQSLRATYITPGFYALRNYLQETWMLKPTVPGCSSGLEYLAQLDQLFVKQKKDLIEVLRNIESTNKYVAVNKMGQAVYSCTEESDYSSRPFCSSVHPFTVHVTDSSDAEVIRIKHTYKYHYFWHYLSCSGCCENELEIEAPVGQVAGYVEQVREGCKIRFLVKDADQNTVLRIHGPPSCWCCGFNRNVIFQTMSVDDTVVVGQITKQPTSSLQDLPINLEIFDITFPVDLDMKIKATLIGAAFLIDFIFFENKHRRTR